MATAVETFDRLIETLAARASASAAGGDAIDDVLASAPRTTQVRSLRDDPVVVQFRQDLVDGLIRMDSANRLLRLIESVVAMMAVA